VGLRFRTYLFEPSKQDLGAVGSVMKALCSVFVYWPGICLQIVAEVKKKIVPQEEL